MPRSPKRSPSRSRKPLARRIRRRAARTSRADNVARLEHRELWLEYWRGKSLKLRNALVEALSRHAVNIARKTVRGVLDGRTVPSRPGGAGVTSDERAAVAVALVRVVEWYDPAKSSLATYMWYAVRGAVIDLWRRQGWFPKRWSRDVKMASIEQMRDDSGSGFPRDVDGDAASDERIPSALVNRDGISAMEGAVETHDQCLRWLRLLDGLDELVIRRRYVEGIAFREIAAELCVTRQRVSFVHRRALDRIREHEDTRKED